MNEGVCVCEALCNVGGDKGGHLWFRLQYWREKMWGLAALVSESHVFRRTENANSADLMGRAFQECVTFHHCNNDHDDSLSATDE